VTSIQPNFIYVGAPKAGSSWLFRALSEHPEVFVSPEKSTTYFETDTPAHIGDYLARFAAAGGARAIGEIAHDTFLNPHAARQIRKSFPKMRILCCLREPRDFARSAVQWWAAHTTRYGTTPAEMLSHERLSRLLDYPDRVSPFFEVFPREQVKVVFFDDLQDAPKKFLQDILAFLEVSPDFHPAVLQRVVNPARRARFPGLTQFAYSAGGVLRRIGFGPLVENVKQQPLVERVLYSPLPSDPFPEMGSALDEIRHAAQPRLDALESIIGRPVPARWRQL
jgi:hypothetical protein